jgi:hypothetical protein
MERTEEDMKQNEQETGQDGGAVPGNNDGQGTSAPAPVRRAASPAKLAANRRNEPKSTGPKTGEGKPHSRWNTDKHRV